MKKRFVTVAGRTVIVRESASTSGGRGKRRPRQNRTPEAVAKVNRTNRERELTAKLNHNFVPGDLWVTLTYEDTQSHGAGLSREECVKKFDAFKKQLQRWSKKTGTEVKMIYVIGIGSRTGRPHHHMVMTGIPTEVIQKAWTSGAIHVDLLRGYNYQKLAKYMLKDAKENEDGKIQRAYNCTRNIVKPETRVQVMTSPALTDAEDIKPFKGYYVDRDSVNTYEHPVFECNCVEYIMVSLEPEPRIKRWNKGRPARPEPQYGADWPEQLQWIMEGGDPEWL